MNNADGYIYTVNDAITWVFNDAHLCWQALIGSYTYTQYDETNYVYALYWQTSKYSGIDPNEPLPFTWEVRVTSTDNPHDRSAWFVGLDKARSPRKAQKAGEYVGKEWLKGDSPLWSEGGDDDDGSRAAEAVYQRSAGILDSAC